MVTEITTHPVSGTPATALEDVTLMCSASIDNVAYSWHRVDSDIPSHSQGQNSSTFTIQGVTPHDEGTYYCTAAGEDGIQVNSDNALIEVDGKICSVFLRAINFVIFL